MMYVLAWRNAYAITRGLFGCLCLELRSNEGNVHQNNTQVGINSSSHEYMHFLFPTRITNP